MKTILSDFIRRQILECLKTDGIPCGKCGKQCPCESVCENPTPTGVIYNGNEIQLSDTSDCNSTCNGCESDKTPLMPQNQVTQFGNTPKFGESDLKAGPGKLFNKQELRLRALKHVLNLLKTKTPEPGVYKGKSITLYKPHLTGENVSIYIKEGDIIIECKFPKKPHNK
jgi:hypothetical protein